MTIDKEIRAVALHYFYPDAAELDNVLSGLDRLQPIAKVKYASHNEKDPTCMEIKLGTKTLGLVNSDDKRYVEPLLRDCECCDAQFLEVYREEGHTPIVRFTVIVDLEEVKPLVANEEWFQWNYSFPKLKMIEEFSTVEYTGHLLKDWFQKKKECAYTTLEELLDSFINASLFDMSVETSAIYDDILFYLETSRNRNRELINRLQHGATVRRTDRVRNRFLYDWWPKFLNSELAIRLCREFLVMLKNKYPNYNEETICSEYKRLDMEMQLLPNNIYVDIDDINSFWACLFYTKVPKTKFIDVLSGLILRTKLKAYIDAKQPFAMEELHIHMEGGTFVQHQTIKKE